MQEIDNLRALRGELCIAKEYSQGLRKEKYNQRKYINLLVLLTVTQMQIEDKEKGGSKEKHAK